MREPPEHRADSIQGRVDGGEVGGRDVAARSRDAQRRGELACRTSGRGSGEVLASNAGMMAVLAQISPERTVEVSQGVMSIELVLSGAEPRDSSIYRLFRAAAHNAVEWTAAVRRWRPEIGGARFSKHQQCLDAEDVAAAALRVIAVADEVDGALVERIDLLRARIDRLVAGVLAARRAGGAGR